MTKTNNLQEICLTQARRERRNVTMFLMNGFQMRGQITGFDAFTVVLNSDGKQQIISSTPSPPSFRSGLSRSARRGRTDNAKSQKERTL